MSQVEFGFVAALEREVSGLVRGWSTENVRIAATQYTIYGRKQAVLICAGTGVERAYAATKVLLENFSPAVVFSIGFAGSCVPDLRPGSVVVPASLTEAATGRVFQCAFGRGQLVTLDRVAGKALKQEVAGQFGAQAVDMEAAGVAAAAAECNRQFAAIKAISDGAEEDLSFLSPFIMPEGFQTGRVLAHIAVRPALWPSVAALNRNSELATKALAATVEECLADGRGFVTKHSSSASQIGLEERIWK
jgi:nucleoside phosphorylase